jgi:Protein of unknown function (DUF2911)
MLRLTCWFVLSALLFLIPNAVFAQRTDSSATATCNFDSTKQLAVEYGRFTVDIKKQAFGKEIPYGKVWAPGGKPMTMFTNIALTVDDKDLPVGAYTLFVIPDENKWTLIISRSTDMSGKYNKQQDLMRVPMELGELPNPEPQFSVYFAHVGADQCNMRVDLQSARAWVTFKEKK